MVVSRKVVFDKRAADKIGKSVRKTEANQLLNKGQSQKRIIWQGGDFDIERVPHLPPIPESGCKFIIWLEPGEDDDPEDPDTATGDGQLWFADQEDDRWYPVIRYTYHSGIPLGILGG